MRKMIFAVFTVVALALSLSVGVASASVWPARDGDYTCTDANGAPESCTFGNGHGVPSSVVPCVIASGSTSCTGDLLGDRRGGSGLLGGLLGRGPRGPRGFPGNPGVPIGPGYPGYYPGYPRGGYPYPGVPQGFPTLVDGNQLNLQQLGLIGVGVGTVDVCNYPSFNQFDGTFGSRYGSSWNPVRSRFGGNANGSWLALRQAARCGGAYPVPVTGFPTLVDGNQLNLGAYGMPNGGPVSVCSYPSWDAFSNQWAPQFGNGFDGLRDRFGGTEGDWQSGWGKLRSQAQCSNNPTVINGTPAPTIINNNNTTVTPSSTVISAPETVEAPAPPPVHYAPVDPTPEQNPELVIPRGSVNSGGYDAAYAAAHIAR